MYNEEIKQAFLDIVPSQKVCRTTFNNFAPFESDLLLDIAQMERKTIIDILNGFEYTEPQTARNNIMYINQYREWCREKDILPCISDDISRIDIRGSIDFVTPISKNYFISFDDVLSELAGFYDFNQGDEAAPSICLFWLGYKAQDICSLKTKLVDLNKRCIYNEDGSVAIDNIDTRIVEILKTYKTTYSATRTQNRTFRVTMYDSGYFIHKMITANSAKQPGETDRRQIARRIAAAKSTYEMATGRKSRLEPSNIYKSGRLYRLRQLELSGVDVFSFKNESLVKQYYGTGGIQFSDIIIQYESYKKAFNLQ